MLRQVLYVARKDLKFLFRARETWVWAFLMPIVFFYFIGATTGGGGRWNGKSWLWIHEGDAPGFLAEQLEQRLAEQDFVIANVADPDSFAMAPRRLTLPAQFTDSLLAGRPVTLLYHGSGDAETSAFRRVKLMRGIYGLLADVVVTGEAGEAPTAAALAALDSMPRALSLDVSAAGEYHDPPNGFQQAVPGIMVMFTILILGTSGAILLVIERRQGLLRRLAYTPIPRLGVVAGKWLGKLVLGLIQIGFAMVAGTLIFHVQWGAHFGAVLALMFTYAALVASLGMLLGSVTRSEGQTAVLGVLSANVLGALGGCWWPIEITPPFMQKLALFLPTGWAMDGLHKLMSFGRGAGSVTPHIVGMGLLSLLLLWLSARIFRFD